MSGSYKIITIQQFIDAVKQNGYNQIQNAYINRLGACAYGQAALNLDVPPSILHTIMWEVIGVNIPYLNDVQGLSIAEIAERLEREVPKEIRAQEIKIKDIYNWKESFDIPTRIDESK